jgi:hypothetical protein
MNRASSPPRSPAGDARRSRPPWSSRSCSTSRRGWRCRGRPRSTRSRSGCTRRRPGWRRAPGPPRPRHPAALRPKYSAVGELVAVVAIAAGCVGAGSNLAVLTYVDAPRPRRPRLSRLPCQSAPRGTSRGPKPPQLSRGRRRLVNRQPPASDRPLRSRASVPAPSPAGRRGTSRNVRRRRGPRAPARSVAAGAARSSACRPAAAPSSVRLTSDWCQCYRGTSAPSASSTWATRRSPRSRRSRRACSSSGSGPSSSCRRRRRRDDARCPAA